jgi:hypothetical protein
MEMVGWGALAVGAWWLLSNFGFSSRSRDAVIGRSGNRSELSGSSPPEGEAIHVMHKNHSRVIVDGLPYDHPERGMAVTLEEHYEYHRIHIGKASLIGMSEDENSGAVALLWSQVQKYMRKRQEVLECV